MSPARCKMFTTGVKSSNAIYVIVESTKGYPHEPMMQFCLIFFKRRGGGGGGGSNPCSKFVFAHFERFPRPFGNIKLTQKDFLRVDLSKF